MFSTSPFTERDPKEDFKVVNNELRSFNPELAAREQVVALNKVDVTEANELVPEMLKFFEGLGIKVFPISAATGKGLAGLVNYVGKEVERFKTEEKAKLTQETK